MASLDLAVSSIVLNPREVVPIESPGVILKGLNAGNQWRNKVFSYLQTGSFAVARVKCSDYTNAVLTLIADGNTAWSGSITDDTEFALPVTLPDAKNWQFDLAQAGEVYEVHLLSRLAHVTQDGRIEIRAEDGPASWLNHRITSPVPLAFSVGRVIVDVYPVTVVLSHAGIQDCSISVTDDNPFLFPVLAPQASWTLDVIAPRTASITQALLLPRKRVPSEKALTVRATDAEIQPWLFSEYTFAEGVEFVSSMVKATTYPLMVNFTTDSGQFSAYIADGTEFAVPAMGRVRTMNFAFTDVPDSVFTSVSTSLSASSSAWSVSISTSTSAASVSTSLSVSASASSSTSAASLSTSMSTSVSTSTVSYSNSVSLSLSLSGSTSLSASNSASMSTSTSASGAG